MAQGVITWEQYLYRAHSRDELQAWAQRLRYFRFCRAYGGHANDGDRLLVALAHTGEADALDVCARLDSGIVKTGYTSLAGVQVLVGISERQVTLTLSGAGGDFYEVTELDVANALTIEPRIALLAQRVIDPPVNNEHCIAPATHPELRW